MEFSRQEYWSELPFPTPGDLPNSRTKPACLSCVAYIGSQILLPLGHLGNPSILYIASTVYICQSLYPNVSPLPSPLSVHTFVLYFCFANRFICTTFLQQKIAQHCKATILKKKKKYIQCDNFQILNSKITRKKIRPLLSNLPMSILCLKEPTDSHEALGGEVGPVQKPELTSHRGRAGSPQGHSLTFACPLPASPQSSFDFWSKVHGSLGIIFCCWDQSTPFKI